MYLSFSGYRVTLKPVVFGGLPTTRKSRRSDCRVVILLALAATAMGLLASCAPGDDDRIHQAYTMARHPTPRNTARIEALLHDTDRDVRATSLVVMDTIDRERAKRMAEIALDDPDGFVRAAAIGIAGSAAGPESIPRLTALAASDPVWQVRTRALEALSKMDDPSLPEVFDRALSDSVRHVRRRALAAGIEHPGLLSVARLSDIVASDPDWENRVDAARALGASNDPAASAGLTAALADPNEFVRAAASRARRGLPAGPAAP
jgi:HEAT repeat protein